MNILIELTDFLQKLKLVSYSSYKLAIANHTAFISLIQDGVETRFELIENLSRDKYLELESLLKQYSQK